MTGARHISPTEPRHLTAQATTRTLGIGLGPLPPLVILSACHVAPRGTGQVTIADLLLRENALAVLGTLVPVDVLHNAMLLTRLFVYMNLAAAGEEEHTSVRELWHRVQTSNAIHDITSGTPRLLNWFMRTHKKAGLSPHELFKNSPLVRDFRMRQVYDDSKTLLLKIADDLGDGDRVRAWLQSPGFVPETAFYSLIGNPESISFEASL